MTDELLAVFNPTTGEVVTNFDLPEEIPSIVAPYAMLAYADTATMTTDSPPTLASMESDE